MIPENTQHCPYFTGVLVWAYFWMISTDPFQETGLFPSVYVPSHRPVKIPFSSLEFATAERIREIHTASESFDAFLPVVRESRVRRSRATSKICASNWPKFQWQGELWSWFCSKYRESIMYRIYFINNLYRLIDPEVILAVSSTSANHTYYCSIRSMQIIR